ncbi:hypothetical protein A3850_011890 [Lewinella sp. 4G2]|nr:hypothetical protein A3850_011890 [Lewinella sp. 4G2]
MVITALMGLPVYLTAQNVDYEALVNSYQAQNMCNDLFGDEDYTWKSWFSDDEFTTEVGGACTTQDANGSTTVSGQFTRIVRNNIAATELRARLDAWENDENPRCEFDNGDDCRTQTTCVYPFTDPLENTWRIGNETCGSGNYSMGINYRYRYTTIDLRLATDFVDEQLLAGGSRPFWGAVGNWANGGSDCAASGTIGDNAHSNLRFTTRCKETLTFDWRVSSEVDGDYLQLYKNNVLVRQISGQTRWATVTIPLDAGYNIIEWRYQKNGSISAGEDRGWIDHIRLQDATSLNPGSISGTQTICSGGNPSNLASTAAGVSFGTNILYQWQISIDQVNWRNIGTATNLSYNPPAGLSQTVYYRRRATDNCGITGFSNVVTVTVKPLPNGSLTGDATICEGNSANLTFTATSGTAPFDLVFNGTSYQNLTSGTQIPVTPTTTTIYSLSSVVDDNGCVRTSGLGTSATVTVETNSTPPTIAPVSPGVCPNTNIVLSASGGIVGTGAVIRWYTGPNGTGSLLGSGPTVTVSPTVETTYYARREGNCNTTADASVTVSPALFGYIPVGTETATSSCTDNDGWTHFVTGGGVIILSIKGDFAGATVLPQVSVRNNGTFYVESTEAGDCTQGNSPGERRYELPRSWNVDFTGTLNGTYDVRFYYPSSERMAMETAADEYITANPDCNYTYKYATPNGFRHFKNVGGPYVAPQYDESISLASTSGLVAGIEYAEFTGITSFSGGSGGIVLSSAVVPNDVAFLDDATNGYPSIQAAIDAATDGQTLFILGGNYNETTDFGTKMLTVKIGMPPTNN